MSRRSPKARGPALAGLAVLALGVGPAPQPAPLAAQDGAVCLCHVDVDDQYPEWEAVTIVVSSEQRAVHIAHGDCVMEPPVGAGQACTASDPDGNELCGDQ